MTAAARTSPTATAADRKDHREVLTPEGVPITFELASVSDRASAVIIDIVIIALVLTVIGALASVAVGASFEKESWLRPLILVAAFLIQNFYFVFFELRWQGWTPGKRIIGIRVIDARGGPLTPTALLARNLIRELELWMPLDFFFGRRAMWPDAPSWMFGAAGVWLLVFLLMPAFNRDRLRAGDLIAGTWVVVQPKPELLPDLAAEEAPWFGRRGPAAAAYTFTDQQLGVYGEFELTVLEQALRGEPGATRTASLIAITNKIRVKLRYEHEVRLDDVELFLNTYYTAVRAHLERRRLFGKRKADKYS